MDVEAINLTRRTALWSDGTVVKIDSFYDAEGEETDDPDEALSFVCPTPTGEWAVVLISDYVTEHTLH